MYQSQALWAHLANYRVGQYFEHYQQRGRGSLQVLAQGIECLGQRALGAFMRVACTAASRAAFALEARFENPSSDPTRAAAEQTRIANLTCRSARACWPLAASAAGSVRAAAPAPMQRTAAPCATLQRSEAARCQASSMTARVLERRARRSQLCIAGLQVRRIDSAPRGGPKVRAPPQPYPGLARTSCTTQHANGTSRGAERPVAARQQPGRSRDTA